MTEMDPDDWNNVAEPNYSTHSRTFRSRHLLADMFDSLANISAAAFAA